GGREVEGLHLGDGDVGGDSGQGRGEVDLVDGDGDLLLGGGGGAAVVGHLDREGVDAGALRLGRRPAELARGGDGGGAGGGADQAERRHVGRHVAVAERGRERQRDALVDLGGDRHAAEHWGAVDFQDVQGDGRVGVRGAVADADREGVVAGALSLRRRP